MSFRISREAGLFRVDRFPVVFCFHRILISESVCQSLHFQSNVLCKSFMQQVSPEELNSSLFSSFEIRASLIIRVMTGTIAGQKNIFHAIPTLKYR